MAHLTRIRGQGASRPRPCRHPARPVRDHRLGRPTERSGRPRADIARRILLQRRRRTSFGAWAGALRGRGCLAEPRPCIPARGHRACRRGMSVPQLLVHAFRTGSSALIDPELPESEQQGVANLVRGAVGALKNPHSHRSIQFDDPTEAAEIVVFVSFLLRISTGRRRAEPAGAAHASGATYVHRRSGGMGSPGCIRWRGSTAGTPALARASSSPSRARAGSAGASRRSGRACGGRHTGRPGHPSGERAPGGQRRDVAPAVARPGRPGPRAGGCPRRHLAPGRGATATGAATRSARCGAHPLDVVAVRRCELGLDPRHDRSSVISRMNRERSKSALAAASSSANE